MFFWKKNDLTKEKAKSKELLVYASKVHAYRCDVINPIDLESLETSAANLRARCKANDSDARSIALSRKALEKVLTHCGGSFYPVKFFPENIEMLLVSVILAIGIRTFFFQPFIIPTNSMYPAYHGMRPVAYTAIAKAPNALEKLWRFTTLGSSHQTVESPYSGEVQIPLRFDGQVETRYVPGRKWLGLLPDMKQQLTFYVNKQPVKFNVPGEFAEVEELIRQAYFPAAENYAKGVFSYAQENDLIERRNGKLFLKTGKYAESGKPLISFDILKGDMIFVNRWVYHFKEPKLGDPFVFATHNIKGLNHPDGSPEEKYFIKRLVGLPGDRLEVKPPVIYRNRAPIKGSIAFDANALKRGNYPGYTAQWGLSGGKEIIISPHSYYAMGDNSPYSSDSRVWGFVPKEEVVGRAAFIFYPFTRRWGNTH